MQKPNKYYKDTRRINSLKNKSAYAREKIDYLKFLHAKEKTEVKRK